MRRWREAGRVMAPIEVGSDLQARSSCGRAGEVEDLLVGVQGLAGPVE